MLSWLAPFVVAVFIAVLYFVIAAKSGAERQQAMRKDMNFYFILVLATSVTAIIGGLRFGSDWIDTAAWIVAVLAIIVAILRLKTAKKVTPVADDDNGPLH